MIPVTPGRRARVALALGTLCKTIRGQNLIAESVDPEVYNIPRNLDIFPNGLGSYAQSKQALDQPLYYTLSQLKSKFQRSNRDEDHIENIYVSSAQYCKQLDDTKHEFLLLEVRDERIPQISNFAVLDRTVNASSSGNFGAISTSVSSSSAAQDRLRVSCYGKKDILIKQCNLGPYEVLERIAFSSSTPLLLYELVILAHETSKSRSMYNLMSAQCFWFAGCIWECMRTLRPEACRADVAESNSRGRFGNFFRQDVNDHEVEDILYKYKLEIRQFRIDLARGQQATWRTRVNAGQENVQHYRQENEELRNELERLRGAAENDRPMRVTAWGFMAG